MDDGTEQDRVGRRRIGLREVSRLRIGETIWDTMVIGFGARRQRGEAVSFILSYRTQVGRKRLLTIGRWNSPWTADEARTEARRLLGVVAGGGDPMLDRDARRGASTTVAELCDSWIADSEAGRVLTRRRVQKRSSTIATDRSRVDAHVKPLIGSLPVIAVTRQDIERLMYAIAAGHTRKRTKLPFPHALSNVRGGMGTASRTVSMLHTIMAYAVRLGLRPDNPVAGVVRPADNRRDRRLSDEEYARFGKALLAAQDDRVHHRALAAIWFLALTGWRRGEVLNLRWAEVDLVRRTARLSSTKTGPSMRPLAKAACIILHQMPRGTFVFQSASADAAMADLVRPWKKATKLAQLGSEVTPHVLRHSFASVAADLNYGDATIAGLLGHTGHSITRRYIHSADTVLLATADAVAEQIIKMMGEMPAFRSGPAILETITNALARASDADGPEIGGGVVEIEQS